MLSLSILLGALIGEFNAHCLVFNFSYVYPMTCVYIFNLCNVFLVKLPQILKIIQARSVKGLSYLAFILELGAVTFTCTYNYDKGFPFRYIRMSVQPDMFSYHQVPI